MKSSQYDYIIAGAGLAGLSLAWNFVHSSHLRSKRILVVDQSFTAQNDKTWSFWSREKPPFSDLIYKSWNQGKVVFKGQTILNELREYTYHSIQSGTFTQKIVSELSNHNNIDLLESDIQEISGDEKHGQLVARGTTFKAPYIFQSCFMPPKLKKDTPEYPLIQHFLGWEIETNEPAFDPSTITLMDFDSSFSEGIAFVYILPQSKTKALLEYTIFSDQLKQKEFYREKLGIYLHNRFGLQSLDYSITRTEFGQIPMKDYQYAPWYAPRVLNMGTVGGLTKPSTGYTFSRIQRHVQAITENLANGKQPALPYQSAFRYRAYDLWLLHIIYHHPKEATNILRQLFSNNSMDEVFRFLAEENTLSQDLKMMSQVSYAPFLRAIWHTKERLLEL